MNLRLDSRKGSCLRVAVSLLVERLSVDLVAATAPRFEKFCFERSLKQWGSIGYRFLLSCYRRWTVERLEDHKLSEKSRGDTLLRTIYWFVQLQETHKLLTDCFRSMLEDVLHDTKALLWLTIVESDWKKRAIGEGRAYLKREKVDRWSK